MGSPNDTDELTGPPRSETDPSFPGPITPRSLAAAEPPSAPPQAEAAAAVGAAAPRAPSDKPPSLRPPSDPPRRGHTESIDELIDGLAGDGQLPRKSKSGRPRPPGGPASDAKIEAAARKPQPPAPAAEPLPSIVLRESGDSSRDGLEDDDGDRRSDPTVLTPTVLARRTRAQTWIAAVMGIVVALAVLALLRSLTRSSDDAVAPASTHSTGVVATAAPTAIPPATTVTAASTAAATTVTAPTGASGAAASPVVTAAPRPTTAASAARSAAPAAATTNARPTTSSELEDFRKTIRQ